MCSFGQRGLLGELESDDVKRIQRELSGAKSQMEEWVWSSYNHLLLWDANQGKLKDVPLGQLHPSEAKATSGPSSIGISTARR
jgi:hypothetical protein